MLAPALKVRLYGDPCLRKKSLPLKDVGPGERLLINAMIATMYHYKGIGLAAPQVGINQRIIVVDIDDDRGPRVFINPEIIKKNGEQILDEGCLSLPGVNISVKRSARILIRFLDEHGRKQEETFLDLMSRAIQHEMDHLDGKLIVDYAGMIEKRKLKKKLEALESSPVLLKQKVKV